MQRGLEAHTVAVAPVGKIGQQISDNKKRIFIVAGLVPHHPRALTKRHQGNLGPGGAVIVTNALVCCCVKRDHCVYILVSCLGVPNSIL